MKNSHHIPIDNEKLTLRVSYIDVVWRSQTEVSFDCASCIRAEESLLIIKVIFFIYQLLPIIEFKFHEINPIIEMRRVKVDVCALLVFLERVSYVGSQEPDPKKLELILSELFERTSA